jgi:lipooligosaccharide transport system permease protein
VATPLWIRPLSYWMLAFRRTWKSDVSTTFLSPALYLASIGVGLGHYVDRGQRLASLGGHNYLSFVAPALLATTAMQLAANQATYPVLGAYKWSRVYRDMLASPLSIDDILVGHIVYMTLRVLMVSAVYLVISALFGAVHSWLALGELVVGPLVGLAFSTPLAAYAIRQQSEWSFAVIYRFVMVPLFLFSGTFFAISQLPAVLQPLAYVLPLWHGVSLCRGLSSGHLDGWGAVGNLAYLVLVAGVGFWACRINFRRRMVI